ncbi:MAG: putative glycoside hydrolase [bacterium]|nr:putative glycoside hydrolase [bacterium]
MRRAVQLLIFLLAGGGLFLFANTKNDFLLTQLAQNTSPQEVKKENLNGDIPLQRQLLNPPEIIKAVYATGWTAGSVKGLNRLIDLIKKTELNAIVIDIKDYSGEMSYPTEISKVEEYGKGRDIKILRPNAMIKKLHDEGIYVIARQTVFQDPVLAKARPDLALTSSSTGKQWLDNKKVMWIDPVGKESWDYNVEIAKDAFVRGFDEVNFDYIRFASDGNLNDIKYPFWDEKALKRYVIRDFFKYMRKSFPDNIISADLFGLVTLNYGDVGIGQNIDDAYHYFDAIAPMVYPSHYNKGFDGYQNPADHPYEVVYSSILEANERLKHYIINAANSTSTEKYLVKNPQLRPWLQDFDLGATYDAEKVRAQMNAVYNAATGTPVGWMLWDPSNIYTKAALLSE